MNFRRFLIMLLSCVSLSSAAAPVIDPISTVTIPAGKSLILPVTATSPNGRPLTFSAWSSNPQIAVVMHTNNPFWRLTVARAAAPGVAGAYQTPYRGGLVTVTNVGAMTFMLFPEYAPHTVNVFQGLTASGFYNSNTIFHRVVANFVIQGGDPQTNGTGGLVFQYDDEFNPQAGFSGNGQLALANAGKDTDGSQFFVTVGPQRELDFGYTLFGQLVRGFNVLTNLSTTAVNTNSRPLADEIIQLAAAVPDTADTVLTLTAANVPGITGAITVIADDGAGGRATNVFSAVSATDASDNHQAFIYPGNTATNRVAPVNTTLTNYIYAAELNGDELYWSPALPDQTLITGAPASNFSTVTNVLTGLTYNVTNIQGRLQLLIVPATNFIGRVNLALNVSDNPQWYVYKEYGLSLPPYDYQYYSFVFGDTPIAGQSNSVTVLAGAAFTNELLAVFTNGFPGSATTNFTATVNWGDDTIASGMVTTNATGQKAALGAHTYAYPGTYPVYVQIQSTIGATATILTDVTAISALPTLSILASPGAGSGGWSLAVHSPAGLNVYIQASTDLVNWTNLTNFTATSATTIFQDPAANNFSRKYYRALIP